MKLNPDVAQVGTPYKNVYVVVARRRRRRVGSQPSAAQVFTPPSITIRPIVEKGNVPDRACSFRLACIVHQVPLNQSIVFTSWQNLTCAAASDILAPRSAAILLGRRCYLASSVAYFGG